MLCRASVYSDDPTFHGYVDKITRAYLASLDAPIDAVSQFLVVIHADLSADVYINDFPVAIEARARRAIEAGAGVTKNDISDMRRVVFPGVSFDPTDQVLYCFKADWRFSLFFDLTRNLDVEKMALDLGQMRRALWYRAVYRTIEDTAELDAMRVDGWFPFIEIIAQFEQIAELYQNRFAFEERMDAFLDGFTPDRIQSIVERWWGRPRLAERRESIEAGIGAYLQGDQAGYLLCMPRLYADIDCIMKSQFYADTGKDRVRGQQKAWSRHFADLGVAASGDETSLFLARHFQRYLEESFFAPFNIETGEIPPSRNSVLHGALGLEGYTRARALQAILILDQLCHYLLSAESSQGAQTPPDSST